MIKYYKFGFGRASDYVNEMIRLGIITRDEGKLLCENYDGRCSDSYIKSFCEYIEIPLELFWEKVTSVVNRELFSVHGPSDIRKKFKVGSGTAV